MQRKAATSRRRRRVLLAVLACCALGAFVLGLRVSSHSDGGTDEASAGPGLPTLPGGGRRIFPGSRVVAFYGAPQDQELGALGVGGPVEAGRKLRAQARKYRGLGKPVLPAFELIVVITTADPGASGNYTLRQPKRAIRKYLRAARRENALLILDIQPGTADFMDEVQAIAPFLKQPDVSLALDPEWHIQPGEIPGQTLGSVDAASVNEVGSYLSGVVRRNDLPQKLLVVHQFTDDMITSRETLTAHPGVALTLNVDGFGDQPNKVAKYRALRPSGDALGDVAYSGFKLFYSEDEGLMSPRTVVGLRPSPSLIVYE